eukprot:TRINITY_DN10994_c0_g1_i2.p1 TRINITY_DN10994_c0_g1~~TRINITY_DN10994_c0_g1_i2.p1  ORF type:complete len:401 (-),score=69.22 TRINITY_DN10994_c0_g1_i2:171-1373(-)
MVSPRFTSFINFILGILATGSMISVGMANMHTLTKTPVHVVDEVAGRLGWWYRQWVHLGVLLPIICAPFGLCEMVLDFLHNVCNCNPNPESDDHEDTHAHPFAQGVHKLSGIFGSVRLQYMTIANFVEPMFLLALASIINPYAEIKDAGFDPGELAAQMPALKAVPGFENLIHLMDGTNSTNSSFIGDNASGAAGNSSSSEHLLLGAALAASRRLLSGLTSADFSDFHAVRENRMKVLALNGGGALVSNLKARMNAALDFGRMLQRMAKGDDEDIKFAHRLCKQEFGPVTSAIVLSGLHRDPEKLRPHVEKDAPLTMELISTLGDMQDSDNPTPRSKRVLQHGLNVLKKNQDIGAGLVSESTRAALLERAGSYLEEGSSESESSSGGEDSHSPSHRAAHK